MIARFTSRKPLAIKIPAPISDTIPWSTPYVPGTPMPNRALLPEGKYTLTGALSGSAKVSINHTPDHKAIATVAVVYDNYSDEPGVVFNGSETITESRSRPTTSVLDWQSRIVQTGKTHGEKVTSPDHFRLTIDIMMNKFEAAGSLTTTVDGRTYRQPANGT